ncbi:MAG: hypothetical protein Q9162_000172 [Coniocarpon cinnabarinum]
MIENAVIEDRADIVMFDVDTHIAINTSFVFAAIQSEDYKQWPRCTVRNLETFMLGVQGRFEYDDIKKFFDDKRHLKTQLPDLAYPWLFSPAETEVAYDTAAIDAGW